MNDTEFCQVHRRALVDDRMSGASQLARQALDSLAEYAGSSQHDDAASLKRGLLEFAEQLQFARPNMAPIHNLVQRWMDRVDELPADDLASLRRIAADLTQELSDVSLSAVERAAQRAAELIGDRAVVITHSLSSTVTETFRALAGRETRAIVTESRPGLEGHQQALHLDRFEIPTSFITDAQLGHFMQRASVALVGADTVLGDGALVNKAGTYLLALAARDRGIPFYVCCESFKEMPYTAGIVEPEQADAAELEAPRGKYITPFNVYFDITPASLIDAWVTDEKVRRGEAAWSEAVT